MHAKHPTYWQVVWKQFCQHRLGLVALMIVYLFVLVGIYAPLLASSKPLVVYFQGHWYFPLFRYLFYPGFFNKQLDIFYNLLMFTFPLFVGSWIGLRNHTHLRLWIAGGVVALQFLLFLYLIIYPPYDPASSISFNQARQQQLQRYLKDVQLNPLLAKPLLPIWQQDLQHLTPYTRLNLVLRYQLYQAQHQRLQPYEQAYYAQAKQKGQSSVLFPSLWNLTYQQEQAEAELERQTLEQLKSSYPQAKGLLSSLDLSTQDQASLLQAKQIVDSYEKAQAQLAYLQDRRTWLEQQTAALQYEVMPLLRPFHWEDDAGGDQRLNHFVSWWDLTRINRKDMVASLLFGVRVSLSVGLLAIGLALAIGIPIGAVAGYYGGKFDLVVYRLIEIWESMPTFFMLLMIVAVLQSKSIFLVIAVIGFFGWTSFSRFVRGEFFRQKEMLYVEACRALGYRDRTIMFSHLLPNAIPPLLTLVPFAIMGAITSEAGLSFLGLGEEGSNSWGVLMDEGRTAFPSESYLLWPPAILLTILLVAIALVGDSLRDALDPKLHTTS